MKFVFQESKLVRTSTPRIDPKGKIIEIRSRSLEEAWWKLDATAPILRPGRHWIHIGPREVALRHKLDAADQTVKSLNDDLSKALELLHAGLLLRMHGDISHQPMTQKEWDSKTEEFLRSFNKE